jgi:hypothetical protein
MRPSCFLPILLGLTLLCPSAAKSQGPDGKSELAANAALQYSHAFSQLPTLDKEQEEVLGKWNTVSMDDPAVQKLLGASQSSMLFLRRAANLPHCNWGLDYNDGVSMLLPHLAKGRDLARLACLHARQEFEAGNRKAARVDAMAIMTLARHVGSEPVMICVLVRYLIEGMVVDLVAPYVPELKASHAEAKAAFDGLPRAPGLLPTIAVEKKYFIEWMIKKMREEEQRKQGGGLELWKNLVSGPETPEALKQISSVDEGVKLIERTLPVYDELAKFVALPKDQFDAQFPAFKEKTKAANPLAGTVLPAVDQILAKEHRNQARFAMLLAAIAVTESGPDKLQEFKDPFGNGPFEHRKLDNGFELKSKLHFEGQPVTLVAGRPQKP